MSIGRVLILEDLAETRRWLAGIVREAFPAAPSPRRAQCVKGWQPRAAGGTIWR